MSTNMNITSQSLLNAGTTNELFAADFSDFAAEDAAPEEPSGAMLQPCCSRNPTNDEDVEMAVLSLHKSRSSANLAF